MTDRIFADSIEPDLIPLDQVGGVLLYTDGAWPATVEQATAFTQAGKAIAWITTQGDWRNASIGDVENGDMTVEDAPLFIKNRDRFKRDSAIIYVDHANLDELEARCAGLTYWRFVAQWDNDPEPIPGVRRLLAKQYQTGDAFDLSAWYRRHVHPDPSRRAA
jgi:hypothetical protein